MKILVEVNENKAAFMMELLQSLPFVKAKKVKPIAADDLREALKEIKLHEEGKIQLPDAREVFEKLAAEK